MDSSAWNDGLEKTKYIIYIIYTIYIIMPRKKEISKVAQGQTAHIFLSDVGLHAGK